MGEVITAIGNVCSSITGVGAVIALIALIISKARSPEKNQNKRIEECEKEIEGIKAQMVENKKEVERKFKKDLERLDNLEHGTMIIQKALLALLRHGIDGNDIDAMRNARDELETYLVEHKK